MLVKIPERSEVVETVRAFWAKYGKKDQDFFRNYFDCHFLLEHGAFTEEAAMETSVISEPEAPAEFTVNEDSRVVYLAKRRGRNTWLSIVLGRKEKCDIQLLNPAISDFQASFSIKNGIYIVKRHSVNSPTSVISQRDGPSLEMLLERDGPAFQLFDGDVIKFGNAIKFSYFRPETLYSELMKTFSSVQD